MEATYVDTSVDTDAPSLLENENILPLIFDFLSEVNLLRVASVCRLWRDLVHDYSEKINLVSAEGDFIIRFEEKKKMKIRKMIASKKRSLDNADLSRDNYKREISDLARKIKYDRRQKPERGPGLFSKLCKLNRVITVKKFMEYHNNNLGRSHDLLIMYFAGFYGACAKGHLRLAEFMLGRIDEVGYETVGKKWPACCQNDEGVDPLAAACDYGRIEIVHMILAELKQRTEDIGSGLGDSGSESEDIGSKLGDSGSESDYPDSGPDYSDLMGGPDNAWVELLDMDYAICYALKKGHFNIVKLMVIACSPYKWKYAFETPEEKGEEDLVDMLLEHGGDAEYLEHYRKRRKAGVVFNFDTEPDTEPDADADSDPGSDSGIDFDLYLPGWHLPPGWPFDGSESDSESGSGFGSGFGSDLESE